jgi:hypothetical protein
MWYGAFRRGGHSVLRTPTDRTTRVGERVTTPAHDAPLVFPSVAFRPAVLAGTCAVLTALAVALSAWYGHAVFGVFFGVGLGLGLLNAVLVRRSVLSITAGAHPLKRAMALNSATRLLVISTVGLAVAYLFRPMGLGVLFGLALFQVVLVISTVLPVWKKIRTADEEISAAGPTGPAIPASIPDEIPKD